MNKKIVLAVFLVVIMCCALCSCNGNKASYEKIISYVTENGYDCDNIHSVIKSGPISDDCNIKYYDDTNIDIYIYNESKTDEYDMLLLERGNDGRTFYSTLTINTKTNEFEFNYCKVNNVDLVYQMCGQVDTFTSDTECDVYTYLDSDEVTLELTTFTKKEVNESLHNLLSAFDYYYEEEELLSLNDLGFVSYEIPEDRSGNNIENLLEGIYWMESDEGISDVAEEYKIDFSFGAAEDYKTTGNIAITSRAYEYLSNHGKIGVFILLDRASYTVEESTIISGGNKYTAELIEEYGTLEWSLYKNGGKIYTYTDDSSKKTVQETNEELERIWEEIEEQHEAVSEKGEPCGSCGKKYEAGDSGGNYKNIAKTGMCKDCYESFKSMSEWVNENQ